MKVLLVVACILLSCTVLLSLSSVLVNAACSAGTSSLLCSAAGQAPATPYDNQTGRCPIPYFTANKLSDVKSQYNTCADDGTACCADPCSFQTTTTTCLSIKQSDGFSPLCAWMPYSSSRFRCISKWKLCAARKGGVSGCGADFFCNFDTATNTCALKMAYFTQGNCEPQTLAQPRLPSSSSPSSSRCSNFLTTASCAAAPSQAAPLLCVWSTNSSSCVRDPCMDISDAKVCGSYSGCYSAFWSSGATCVSRQLFCSSLRVSSCTKYPFCTIKNQSYCTDFECFMPTTVSSATSGVSSSSTATATVATTMTSSATTMTSMTTSTPASSSSSTTTKGAATTATSSNNNNGGNSANDGNTTNNKKKKIAKDVVIPIVVILVVGLLVAGFLYYRKKSRSSAGDGFGGGQDMNAAYKQFSANAQDLEIQQQADSV